MKQTMFSFLAAFVGIFITNTLIALLILQNTVNQSLSGYMRTMEEGLQLPAMLSGYALLSLLMAVSYAKLELPGSTLRKGATFGLLTGLAVFFCGHLIVAGWSKLPAAPMAFAGFMDSLSVVVGGILIAYVHERVAPRKRSTPEGAAQA